MALNLFTWFVWGLLAVLAGLFVLILLIGIQKFLSNYGIKGVLSVLGFVIFCIAVGFLLSLSFV